MSDLRIRTDEGCDPDPFLLWDTVPVATEFADPVLAFDWRLAAPGAPLNAGGIAATAALETAVMLSLFTDRWVPDDHPLAYLADGDNRGWWGDGLDVRDDLGEQPLGSFLWLLERAPLIAAETPIERWAEQFAVEALAPLRIQGAVVRIDAQARVVTEMSRVELLVQMYGRDGARVYDRKFDIVWNQL